MLSCGYVSDRVKKFPAEFQKSKLPNVGQYGQTDKRKSVPRKRAQLLTGRNRCALRPILF